jgi:pantetheine-phosphate adenylyltransferase
MEKTALFPGTFDPFTIGHESIIQRALPMFDKIIVAIGYNSVKPDGYFSLEKRMDWIRKIFKDESRVSVEKYSNLTVDFCRQMNAKYILRGLRTSADFEYERAIAQTNFYLAADIETVFLLTTPELTPINSTLVREVIKHGGDASRFVPRAIDLKE